MFRTVIRSAKLSSSIERLPRIAKELIDGDL